MAGGELKTINSVYNKIEDLFKYNDLGFEFVLKKQKNNKARIHIIDDNNNKLTPQFEYTENLSNKRLDKRYDIFKYAYSGSHRERAMEDCYQYLLKNSNLKQNKIDINKLLKGESNE